MAQTIFLINVPIPVPNSFRCSLPYIGTQLYLRIVTLRTSLFIFLSNLGPPPRHTSRHADHGPGSDPVTPVGTGSYHSDSLLVVGVREGWRLVNCDEEVSVTVLQYNYNRFTLSEDPSVVPTLHTSCLILLFLSYRSFFMVKVTLASTPSRELTVNSSKRRKIIWNIHHLSDD